MLIKALTMSGSTNPHIGEAVRRQFLKPACPCVSATSKDDMINELRDAGIMSKEKKKAAKAQGQDEGQAEGQDGDGEGGKDDGEEELHLSKDCER